MKIAIFTNAYKPIISGVVNTIELMSNAYIAKGHEVIIFAPGYYDYVDDDQNIFRYKWVNLTYNMKFPIAIPFSYKAGKMLKNFNPDIIHTHHPFVLGNVAHYYSDLLEKPLVFTFHTQYEMYSHYVPLPTTLVKSYCRNSVKNFASKCDLITTPAQSISDLLKDYGIKNEITVIPNAIDLNAYKNINVEDIDNLKAELNLGDSKVILYAGRIAPEKNLIFLLKSFKTLTERNMNVKLLIVGGGPQLQELKDFASENGLSDTVVFTGMIEYAKMPLYFKVADIFAITSVTEVKPLAILEALAASLPIVAVNAPGASDTLSQMYDGILTDVDNEAFSNGLIKVLTDNALYNKLVLGADQTAYKYSLDNISNDFIDLYQNTINIKNTTISHSSAS